MSKSLKNYRKIALKVQVGGRKTLILYNFRATSNRKLDTDKEVFQQITMRKEPEVKGDDKIFIEDILSIDHTINKLADSSQNKNIEDNTSKNLDSLSKV